MSLLLINRLPPPYVKLVCDKFDRMESRFFYDTYEWNNGIRCMYFYDIMYIVTMDLCTYLLGFYKWYDNICNIYLFIYHCTIDTSHMMNLKHYPR